MILKRYPQWIACILMAIIIFGLFYFSNGSAESALYTASRPIYQVFDYLGSRASGFLNYFQDKKMILAERDALIQEKEELLKELADLSDCRADRRELAEVLGVGIREPNWEMSMAKISYLNTTEDWLMVNLGKRDGLETGQPVINSNHVLVGRVGQVYERQAEVKLLSHPDSVIKVKTVSSSPLVNFIQGGGGLKVNLLSNDLNQPFQPGDNLVTDLFREDYPANLLVGQVVRVERDDIRSTLIAEVAPFFDFTSEQNVFVLQNF